MRNQLINPILVVVSVSLLYSIYSIVNEFSIPTGTVVYSILPPEIFTNINEDWVLLQGQDMNPEWRISEFYHKDTLPNTLGVFIRCSNYNGLGIDPESIAEIGRFQAYATALPKTPFTIETNSLSGDHSHSLGYTASSEYDGSVLQATAAKSLINRRIRPHQSEYMLGGADGEHFHNIIAKGDIETRPSNVTLYAYIKIN